MAGVNEGHSHPHHRDVAGGPWRAGVFGASDGLVSNVSLILGVAGAESAQGFVRLAGLAGLLAGAFSMAAGEYISVKAQTDLLRHELELEKHELLHRPESERRELAAMYVARGVEPELADQVATQLMADPDVALEVHALEELGVNPGSLASPVQAAYSSFLAFALGAMIPLLPWFFGEGTGATIASVLLTAMAALGIGWTLGVMSGGNRVRFAVRQLAIATGAAAVTYVIGRAIGIGVVQ